MSLRSFAVIALFGLNSSLAASASAVTPISPPRAPLRAASLTSVSRLAFGGPDVLFAADWKTARVHAYRLPTSTGAAAAPFNLRDLDTILRRTLGTADVRLEDMAARPGSGEVYIAVSMGTARAPAILVVTAAGRANRLHLARLAETSAPLEKAPSGDTKFWETVPDRSFTVTDMQWHNGKLYVAGLSNEAFSSTLRIIPYPFGARSEMLSVEMYHTSHNQMETRAPIRAMAFTTLDGTPTLLAAYLCTPLVTIPLDQLRDGAHVTGKTIAELGDAGIPVNIVAYDAPDMTTGSSTPMILVANLVRPSNVIPLASVAEAQRRRGYSTPVAFGQMAGVQSAPATMGAVFRVGDQNPQFLVVLRRDPATGTAQLVSVNKMMGFRLTDFDISEYMFPDYQYTGEFQQKLIKPGQNMLKQAEGYPQLMRR